MNILKSIWHFSALIGILSIGFVAGFSLLGILGGILGMILAPIIVLMLIS